ncbi:helix-turn-helix transcriptional regulator [Dinoroseobacter sp. S76]|uniref:helix-turn-helix transcriptional regulator n=1 Tax=Dinoroseobacter sp. S76 TaxID=3415124 RepID=UPI003C7CC111
MNDPFELAPPSPRPAFLDEVDVADMLCQSVRTIQKWRVTGYGPTFYKLGRSVRYRQDEVLNWAEARRKAHTSE